MEINDAVLPIGEASPDESVASVQELPKDHNFADDPDTAAFVKTQVKGIIDYIVANRTGLSGQWAENRRMDYMVFDDNQKYLGRSNSYMPAWAKANKTLISQMSSGLFPTDEYLDCAPMNDCTAEEAAMMKAYMQYQIGDTAKLPNIIKPFLREMNNTGTGVIKYWWNKEHQKMMKKGSLQDSFAVDDNNYSYNEGLMCSARSIHNVYVYPVAAEHPRELQLITEVVQVPNSFIKEMERKGRWVNCEFAINNKNEMNAILEASRLLGEKDNLSADANNAFGIDLGMTYILETYTYMKLPKAAYLDGEDTEAPLPVQIFSVGGTPLCVRRNPFYHQCMPYLFGRDNVHAGSFYGMGLASYIKGLQMLTNDFANQGNDASIYALNPLIVLNPTFMVGKPPNIRPGAVWKTTNVKEGITFNRPPTELIQAAQAVLQFNMGAVADFGGAPPVLQGQSAGKGARTATGAQILQRNALQPLQDTIEDLEGDVMIPLMKRTQALARQYQKRQIGLLVSGSAKTVDPSIFEKRYEFRWLASSQMVNQQMRSQQVLTFIQAVAPLIPYLMQTGWSFDPVPLFKKVYYDGFGFRGFDDIFKRAMAPNVQGMPPGMPQAPGQQQAPAQSQGSGSAFPGGPQMDNPVQGEGDQFNVVNTPAQELAGMLGSIGGGS